MFQSARTSINSFEVSPSRRAIFHKISSSLDRARSSAIVARPKRFYRPAMNDSSHPGTQSVAVFGGAVLDRKYQAQEHLVAATSNPVVSSRSHGGVARNMAENLVRLGVPTAFYSIVGGDEAGAALVDRMAALGADVTGVVRAPERSTAEYVAVLDTDHELALGVADMAIFSAYDEKELDRAWPRMRKASWVLADCNFSAAVLAALAERCSSDGVSLALNTVSAPKAIKLRGLEAGIDLLFTNRDEATALLGHDQKTDAAGAAHALRGAGFKAAVLTDGGNGYAVIENGKANWFPALPASPVDITGAGDAFVAGTLCRLVAGDRLAQATRAGALLAARTTETLESVLPDLSPAFFDGAASRQTTE